MTTTATQPKTRKLQQIVCEPDCGFLLRSHDEAELLSGGQRHGFSTHGMDVTIETVRTWVKPA